MRKPFAETSLGGKGVVVVDRMIIACETSKKVELLVSNGPRLTDDSFHVVRFQLPLDEARHKGNDEGR